ncbi:LOW QUALITY PROTEIN: protein STPG4-like [Haliotis rubra]|uniref:LOW QUALITY PROTEIN: protein STPG4-like n=1 Tax=Haliotis rubra TaxID=36100 RepID=UPI001EE5AAB3|nr:LOW QUALITY PROTEIN: protein STPG4-like [Haliotis rubra]
MATVKAVAPQEPERQTQGDGAKGDGKRRVRIRHSSDSQAYIRGPRHPWEINGESDQNRKTLSEHYEGPVSGREGWWRCYIRETPKPGSYQSSSFVDELKQRPNTYRFKSDGRKVDPHPHGKGATLLPGAYEFPDFIHGSEKKPATYNFKAAGRDAFDVLNFGLKDKDVNVSPTAYGTEQYMTISGERAPSKHFMFKSQSRRFPTTYFRPRDGPGPGMYDAMSQNPPPSVSSSFRSRTPRFSSSHTKIPGPGTYDKTFQHPMKPTISKMGRQYGLFFTSAFQA